MSTNQLGTCTREQLKKDPSILLRLKPSSSLSSIEPIKHFEGRVGAIIFDGSHFVTSPNMDRIYAPPRSPRMTFKRDYRLAEHDALLWPQPFLEPQCHLPCIPRRIEALEKSTRLHYKILFHQVYDGDFFPLQAGPITGLGYLSGSKMAPLKRVRETLEKQLESLDPTIKSTTAILDNLLVFIRRTLISLESLPMTRRQVLFLFAELQRYMLEYFAAHRYLTLYKPRIDGRLPPATVVEDLIGAFVFDLSNADNFVRAGIPVWLIRSAKLAGTVRVDQVVDLIQARDLLCLEDAYNLYQVAFSGSDQDINKYKVFARYSATFLSYTSPFQSLPAEPASNAVNVFAPPSQAPGPSLTSVIRPQHFSSARNVPFPKNSRSKPAGHGGRNKFEEPSSPYLPPPIPAWRDALRKVVVNSDRDPSLKEDGGYIFPDPGLFVGVTTREGLAKFFYNWLKYRPAWIHRLTVHNSDSKPLSTQFWRSMLHMPIDGQLSAPLLPPISPLCPPSKAQKTKALPIHQNTSVPQQTKSAKRLNDIHTLLRNCLNVDDVQINDTASNDICWRGQQLSAGTIPTTRVAQEILWELSELNFRFELMALDSRAHNPALVTTNSAPREDLLLQCFPGKDSSSMLVAQLEFADQGLAASNWRDRASFILAIKNIVMTWPGFDKVIEGCSGVDLSSIQMLESCSEREINSMEMAVATFYTQSFYDFFGRAATIPRCLTSDHN